MDAVSPQRTDKPAGKPNAPAGGDGNPQQGAPSGQNWRWLWGVLAIGIVAILLAVGTIKTNTAKSVSYTNFLKDVSVQAGLDRPDLQRDRGRSPASSRTGRATRCRVPARPCPTT